MPQFTIRETQAVWVTWTYVIEAKSEQDARTKYIQTQPAAMAIPEIGDNVDGYEQIIEVEPY